MKLIKKYFITRMTVVHHFDDHVRSNDQNTIFSNNHHKRNLAVDLNKQYHRYFFEIHNIYQNSFLQLSPDEYKTTKKNISLYFLS